MKRLFSAFGLALTASLVVGALAAGSASALSFSPEGAGYTGAGGAVSIQITTGESTERTCTKSQSFGTTAEMTIALEGCKWGGSDCTSSGQPAGKIVTSKLSVKPVYLDAAKTRVGLMLSPPESGVVAQFTCGKSAWNSTWTGNLIGEITPGVNVSTKSYTLDFVASSQGVQQYQQIEGAGPNYHLTDTYTMFSLPPKTSEMSLGFSEKLSFAQTVKLIP